MSMRIKNQNHSDFVKTRFLLAGFHCTNHFYISVRVVTHSVIYLSSALSFSKLDDVPQLYCTFSFVLMMYLVCIFFVYYFVTWF